MIIKNCPSEIKDFSILLKQCMALLSYDPEYTYNENVDMACDDDDGDGGWGKEEMDDVDL